MKTKACAALAAAVVLGGFAGDAFALQEKKKGGETAKPAAQSATPEERLAQGKLVAESEHDYARALEILTAVASDASVKADVKAQALVAAARCLNQLGRGAEARAQLQAAAQLNGPGADEAKHLLDAGLTDQQLELRIAKAIDELLKLNTPENFDLERLEKSRITHDLVWVGAPAVPRVARVLADVDHLTNVSVATYLLARINTPEAAAAVRDALRQADPFYKRAVLAAFPANVNWSDPIRATVMTLLNDQDAHVRLWVVNDAARLATLEELLPLTRDASDDVRIGAWRAIRSKDEALVGADPVMVELRRCLKEDHDDVRRQAVDLFRTKGILRSAAARELLVTTLLDATLAVESDGRQPHWLPYDGADRNLVYDRPIPLELLVDAAAKLAPIVTYDVNNGSFNYTAPRCILFAHLVSGSATATSGTGAVGWPGAEREKAWKLVRAGLGLNLFEWIAANATPDDVPALIESAAACGDAVLMNDVVKRFSTKLTPPQRSAAAKAMLTLFNSDTEAWERTSADKVPVRWERLVGALFTLGGDEADAALVRAQPRRPDVSYLRWLMDRHDPVVDPRRLAELVTIRINDNNDPQLTRSARNDALGRIAAARLPQLPTLLAPCYELGLGVYNTGSSSARPRGFAWLVVHEPDANEENARESKPGSNRPPRSSPSNRTVLHAEWGAAYSAADVRTAFEACARSDRADFWWDVRTVLDFLPPEGPFDPVATELLQQVMTRIPSLDPEKLANAQVSRGALVEAVLRRSAPGWKEFALANCLDPELGEVVVFYVPALFSELFEKLLATRTDASAKARRIAVGRLQGEKEPALRARAADFLTDPVAGVRKAAIETLFQISPDKALDLVLPLAKDPDSGVRFALYEQLSSCFDRRAIPILVDGLQDPSPGARDTAKKSLDALQYVFEQKDKWKRMLEGAGLDSTNAAEALVKQAASTQPKATRLVAIESLGTLGVAETLPVLINFMGESDAEIAAAAKAAVEKINRRTAEREAGPAGKKSSEKGQ
jgi:HEAT repeat protein